MDMKRLLALWFSGVGLGPVCDIRLCGIEATRASRSSASVVASCTILKSTTLASGITDLVVTNAVTPLDVNGSVTITRTKGAATTIGLMRTERGRCDRHDLRHGDWPVLTI